MLLATSLSETSSRLLPLRLLPLEALFPLPLLEPPPAVLPELVAGVAVVLVLAGGPGCAGLLAFLLPPGCGLPSLGALGCGLAPTAGVVPPGCGFTSGAPGAPSLMRLRFLLRFLSAAAASVDATGSFFLNLSDGNSILPITRNPRSCSPRASIRSGVESSGVVDGVSTTVSFLVVFYLKY